MAAMAAKQAETNAPGGGEVSYGILPRLLGYHLRRAQGTVFKAFAEAITASEDITPGLFGMLQVIANNPGLSQSRLAEAMQVDRSTIVKVVRQLDARSLIERTPSPSDGRSYCLRLSDRGRDAVQRMERRILELEQDFASALSPGEQETLVRLLTRLYREGR